MIFNNRVYMYDQIRQKCPFRSEMHGAYFCAILRLNHNPFNPLTARKCSRDEYEKCPMFTYMELFLEQAKPQMKDW